MIGLGFNGDIICRYLEDLEEEEEEEEEEESEDSEDEQDVSEVDRLVVVHQSASRTCSQTYLNVWRKADMMDRCLTRLTLSVMYLIFGKLTDALTQPTLPLELKLLLSIRV